MLLFVKLLRRLKRFRCDERSVPGENHCVCAFFERFPRLHNCMPRSELLRLKRKVRAVTHGVLNLLRPVTDNNRHACGACLCHSVKHAVHHLTAANLVHNL